MTAGNDRRRKSRRSSRRRAIISSGGSQRDAVFDKIAKKIDGIAKSAKSSVAVDKLSKSLEAAQKQMAAIDKFGTARGGFADARQRFRDAEMAVTRAAQAMKRGEGDARALQRSYDSAQKAVSNASAAFERQKSVVLSAQRALGDMGIPINRAAQHQERLRTAVERTNAALERQPGRVSRAATAAARGIGTIAPFAGPAILAGTKAAVKSGAEIQSEIVKMRAAGIPEADIQRALGETSALTGKYTNVKRGDALERYKELRSVLLHPEEAHELLPIQIQAASAMNAIDSSGHLAEGLGFATKGAEVLGIAQEKGRYRDYINSFIKAQQVMGKTVTPEQQYEMAKYFKASGASLSDRFKMTTGVSMSQELGGSTTGVGVDQFVKQVIGGFQGSQHAAAKSFVALGLANEADFEKTKTGDIKGFKPGKHVTGWRTAQSDPDKWLYDYYLPALAKKGITSPEDINAEVRRDFPNGRAADVVSKMITQRESFKNHAKLYGEAQGLDATENNKSDPFVAFNSLKTSLENFAGTLTSPAMQDAAGILSSMASSLGSWGNELAAFQKDHPELAKGIAGGAMAAGTIGGGALTVSLMTGLMTGFGLPAASVELSTSAAALSAAAAELSGAAIVQKGGSVAGAAAAGGGLWAAGAAALPYLGGALGAGVGAYALYSMTQQPGYDGLNLNSELLRKQRGGSIRDAQRRAFNEDRRRLGIPEMSDFDSPELSPTMTYGTGVTATLTGSADVKGEVTGKFEVVPGSALLSLVESVQQMKIGLSGTLNANGPGSLGHSSPDAAAPAPKPSTGGASGGW